MAQKHRSSHGQGCVPPRRGLRWASELVVFTWTEGVVLGGSPPCLHNQTSRPAAPFPFSFQGARQLTLVITSIQPSDASKALSLTHGPFSCRPAPLVAACSGARTDFSASKFSQLNVCVSWGMWPVKPSIS